MNTRHNILGFLVLIGVIAVASLFSVGDQFGQPGLEEVEYAVQREAEEIARVLHQDLNERREGLPLKRPALVPCPDGLGGYSLNFLVRSKRLDHARLDAWGRAFRLSIDGLTIYSLGPDASSKLDDIDADTGLQPGSTSHSWIMNSAPGWKEGCDAP